MTAVFLTGLIYANHHLNNEKEKKAVKKVIQEAFVDGMENLGDIEVIKKGFHPDYNMFYVRNNQLRKMTLVQCIRNVERQKAQNPDGPKEKASIKFLSVDVTGKVGIAKFEQYKGEKLEYTDILMLIKFNEGWRIIGKMFHYHG